MILEGFSFNYIQSNSSEIKKKFISARHTIVSSLLHKYLGRTVLLQADPVPEQEGKGTKH